MRKLYKAMGLLSLMLLTGCTSVDKTPFPTFSDLTVEVEEEEKSEQEAITQAFEAFFSRYFDVKEEDILLINQKASSLSTAYESGYAHYKEFLLGKVGNYLDSKVKGDIQKGYRTDDFDLPKKIAVNGYVTYGPGVVEKVELLGMQESEEEMLYEVGLTLRHTVQNLEEANKVYSWDPSRNYYVRKQENTRLEPTFSNPKEVSQKAQGSYDYLQETQEGQVDQIKMLERYWVTVEKGDEFKIKRVKEASSLCTNEQTRQVATQTDYLERVPYYDAASTGEELLVKEVLIKLFNVPKTFYTYYECALASDYDKFKALWEIELKLKDKVSLPKKDFKDAFSKEINPYKDDLESFEVDPKEIELITSKYSTQKQPRFIVSIPVKAKTIKGESVCYIYKYYVGMEQGKIECIQYLEREKIEVTA